MNLCQRKYLFFSWFYDSIIHHFIVNLIFSFFRCDVIKIRLHTWAKTAKAMKSLRRKKSDSSCSHANICIHWLISIVTFSACMCVGFHGFFLLSRNLKLSTKKKKNPTTVNLYYCDSLLLFQDYYFCLWCIYNSWFYGC